MSLTIDKLSIKMPQNGLFSFHTTFTSSATIAFTSLNTLHTFRSYWTDRSSRAIFTFWTTWVNITLFTFYSSYPLFSFRSIRSSSLESRRTNTASNSFRTMWTYGSSSACSATFTLNSSIDVALPPLLLSSFQYARYSKLFEVSS